MRWRDSLGPTTLTPSAAAIGWAGVLLTEAAVVVQTLVHLVNRFTIDRATLDVTEEFGLSAWASSGATFTCAVACVFLVAVAALRPAVLLPLASLIAFLSLDEAIVLHERLGTRMASLLGLSESWDSVVWPVVYLPLLACTLALLLVCVRAAPREPARLIVLGLAALGVAVAAEAIAAPLSTPTTADDLPHVLLSAVEEGLELGGWGLIATGLFIWLALRLERATVAIPGQSSVK